MTIRPLTGRVLVEILPSNNRSDGGIYFPESSDDEQPFRDKPRPFKARVVSIGPWPAKNGRHELPPFQPGATVVVNAYAGVNLRSLGDRMFCLPPGSASGKMKIVNYSDVIAEITDKP